MLYYHHIARLLHALLTITTLLPLASTTCYAVSPLRVHAASPATVDPPANLTDGNPNTRWSSDLPAWIELDLQSIRPLSTIELLPYLATDRRYDLKISAKLSADSPWQTIWIGFTAKQKQPFKISLAETVNLRYLRIEGKGNNQNTFTALSHISLGLEQPQSSPPNQP